ncbi:MAG TPA: SDR family oxidoreductase [Bryobacteraceae bacterium]|jgi:nucleoside-diphosphate-sugar epimerase
MRVLFIGGTGIISTACSRLAVERGIDLTLLRRGVNTKIAPPPGVKTVTADLHDFESSRAALDGLEFDSVVDFIGFTPDQMERDIALFRGHTRQFVFISSASAYQKPSTHYLITESTPLANPYWQYSRDKIACEERLMRAYREEGFPITIVRPSHTYGDTQFTLAINSWEKSYTAIDRIRNGRKVIVPGDGTSLWVLTHNSDFAKGLVGLLGLPQAIGHAFHITSDEVMSWNQIYQITAEAAGVEAKIVHVPSDFIVAQAPEKLGGLTGDKSVSVVFDNSKIKRFVPDYCATVPYFEGVRRTVAWFDENISRREIDEASNARWDAIIAAYERD